VDGIGVTPDKGGPCLIELWVGITFEYWVPEG
jgi:hypothetical protein